MAIAISERGGRRLRNRERESSVMVGGDRSRLGKRLVRLVHGNSRDLDDTRWPLSLVGNRNSA